MAPPIIGNVSIELMARMGDREPQSLGYVHLPLSLRSVSSSTLEVNLSEAIDYAKTLLEKVFTSDDPVALASVPGTAADGSHVLPEIYAERAKQDLLYGQDDLILDGVGHDVTLNGLEVGYLAARVRSENESEVHAGRRLSWSNILLKQALSVFAANDTKNLRHRLVKVAAVSIAWIEAIDRREDPR